MKPAKKLVREFCSIVTSGGTPSSGNAAYYGGEIPWLRTQEVTFNRIRNTEISISEAGLKNSAAKWIPENSVIVAMYGASAGRVAVNTIPLTTNQACCNLIINADSDFRFVYYALANSFEALAGSAKGAAQNNLNAGQVKEFEIPWFPIERQEAIADRLWQIDDLIENNRRRITLLEESARRIYCEWFIHLRFPGHEHTKVKAGIPEGWQRIRLGKIAPFAYGKGIREPERIPGDVPVMSSAGQLATHNKALVAGPGLVIGRKGNVGAVHLVLSDFWPTDTTFYISGHPDVGFLFHALPNAGFINTDVAVPGLNRDFAHSRELLWPDDTIRTEFNRIAVEHATSIETLRRQSEKLREARELLLPRLMSGEIEI